MDPEPAQQSVLHFELRIDLRADDEGLRPLWQADLLGPVEGGSMHFDSLRALIRYLTRLDSITPPQRGIR